jgi:hypothetical protein
MIDDLDSFDGVGTIENVVISMSGLARIEFEEGHHVLVESGPGGIETLTKTFGSIEEAVGQRIVYATDASNVMMYFGVLGCDCDACREGI